MRKINNTKRFESKRAHWLQAHCQSAGCWRAACRFHKAHNSVINTRMRTERLCKRENCNRHWQKSERSQLPDKGRDRASQLVCAEESVDFTKYTLLSSAHEHEKRDCANDRIVSVTDKLTSAVNCPIEVGIVPISWLSLTYLLISHSTHCCYQHTNTNIDKRESCNRHWQVLERSQLSDKGPFS